MPRVYVRKFDWDEARQLRAQGWSWQRLADRFGVSTTAVARVCDEATRERLAANLERWQRGGVCDDCGGPMNRISRRAGSKRCKSCAYQAALTTVRGDSVWCYDCKQWKPRSEFQANRSTRKTAGGIHRQCRACNTAAKREWRHRNPGHEAATQKAWRQRRREAA